MASSSKSAKECYADVLTVMGTLREALDVLKESDPSIVDDPGLFGYLTAALVLGKILAERMNGIVPPGIEHVIQWTREEEMVRQDSVSPVSHASVP